MSREVELGCESWTSFASGCFSTVVPRNGHCPCDCPSTAVETAIAPCTSRCAMARGHRLNTSIVLAAVHGLSGLFRAVSAVEPSLFRPLRIVTSCCRDVPASAVGFSDWLSVLSVILFRSAVEAAISEVLTWSCFAASLAGSSPFSIVALASSGWLTRVSLSVRSLRVGAGRRAAWFERNLSLPATTTPATPLPTTTTTPARP